jgi:tRNA pseudouridine55 synthase
VPNEKSAAAIARSGVLLIDKPAGPTSHDVVARVRRLARMRKVGHAGTLDPAASGLLVVGLGSATRLLSYLVGLDKEYLATIRLGASTTTDDAEGEVLEAADPAALAALTAADLERALAGLTGDILQVPSSVSAIKVDGRRSYSIVRAGGSVDLPARPVTVSGFELCAPARLGRAGGLDLEVRVECSSGTYVRALARDLGRLLGVGGHLTALRRTRVGPFRVSESTGLDVLAAQGIADFLREPAAIAAALFPQLRLSSPQVLVLIHGKRVGVAETAAVAGADPVAALAPDGRLVGLARVVGDDAGGLSLVPRVNFPTDEVLA